MTTLNTQLGVVDEGAYGTAATVTRFFEYDSESIEPVVERIESTGLRRGTRVQRSDRFTPINKGAAGGLQLEVHDKGFGFWLKHMLGTVATPAPTDSAYTHTGTIGSLLGDSFTCQINRPFHPSGTDQPFTFTGGKIPKWKLSNDVDGFLLVELDCDFQDEDTDVALAAASYPTLAKPLSWAGGVLLIDDEAVDVTNISFNVDNGLRTDRHYLRGSSLKREPVENAMRDIAFEFECDWASLAQYNRVKSATAAGALGELVATWTGPGVIGAGATAPSLTATVAAGRFDAAKANVSGPDALMQSVSGRGLFDGTNSAIKLDYVTADTTP